MKIIFFGATKFSADILNYLLENRIKIECLFTIPEEFSISYSRRKVKNCNYADLRAIARREGIKSYIADSRAGRRMSDYYKTITEIAPDVIVAAGWYYMVPKKIREAAKYGAWGLHASLLPKYAGGAPLVWAIINGERKTGVTLFRLAGGVDDGDIIAQKPFPIEFTDSIKEVYEKATCASQELLLGALKNIEKVKFKPQDKSRIMVYPQRSPEDGRINLSWPSIKIYNFIRAQSAPYPGAFIKTRDGKKIVIERARIIK